MVPTHHVDGVEHILQSLHQRGAPDDLAGCVDALRRGVVAELLSDIGGAITFQESVVDFRVCLAELTHRRLEDYPAAGGDVVMHQRQVVVQRCQPLTTDLVLLAGIWQPGENDHAELPQVVGGEPIRIRHRGHAVAGIGQLFLIGFIKQTVIAEHEQGNRRGAGHTGGEDADEKQGEFHGDTSTRALHVLTFR
ncbi:MAG: hypothetical protein BWY76_00522 [bacterium ADurb.Bin429]|nr:MAG: hypothetical protein BWY76_00522 [bacterium ADurb.Bin429]